MAAGKTYEPIATTTVSGSTTKSVTFSSIPSTYTDLIIVCFASNDTTGTNLLIRFNSDTGSNYSDTRMFGDGSAAYSDRITNDTYMKIGINGNSSTDFSIHIINVMNYSNATTYKSVIARSGWPNGYIDSYAGLWRSTSAINSIQVGVGSYNLRANSTFTLFGIAAA